MLPPLENPSLGMPVWCISILNNKKFTGRIKTGLMDDQGAAQPIGLIATSGRVVELVVGPQHTHSAHPVDPASVQGEKATLKVEALLLAAETPRWYLNLLGNPVFSLDGLMEALFGCRVCTLLLRGEEKRVTSIGNALHQPVRRGKGNRGDEYELSISALVGPICRYRRQMPSPIRRGPSENCMPDAQWWSFSANMNSGGGLEAQQSSFG
ncbi:hypothetical protein CABS01_09505 [Colletotrichum abscissum]|uniref:uncharacterized protein n=1 Tax=Colletotrichum abscissum TaxID=1671311 RepID=UPI0027D71283|nr:uncharacterized protein CABS01_09505 [Colletotrichum abscissum]KAK1501774.1 hypothetical protein CABS01_09505 [Colletotrichum abscissum]